MKKLFVLVAAGLLVLAAGCDTLNIGGAGPDRGPVPTITAPAGTMYGNETFTFTANWTGGTGPFTIAWDFGGGATNIPAAAATSPSTADATWNTSATAMQYTVTVTVTDSTGSFGTASVTVDVEPTRNAVPVINSVTAVQGQVTVDVTDDDGDPVTVTVSGFTGMSVDSASKAAAQAFNGTAVFNFAADDVLAGATSGLTVDAADDQGGNAVSHTTTTITIDPFPLTADTLYAIPLQTSVNTGDPVTVVVATGTTGSSFQFMTGVGLVVPDDGSYVANSFNVGLPGGARDESDGAWVPITSAFLLAPDGLVQPGPDPDASLAAGSQRFDFNVTPLGGSDVASAEGALFNAQFSFSSAGSKTFSFQQVNGVNRTYYSDFANGTDTFWGSFVDGTVTVN